MAIGLFGRLREGLSKTRESLLGRVEALFQGHPRIDEEFLESLEEILIGADFGMPVTEELVTVLRRRVKLERDADPGRLRDILVEEIGRRLQAVQPWELPAGRPCVIMLIGVNGVGKTTTIG